MLSVLPPAQHPAITPSTAAAASEAALEHWKGLQREWMTEQLLRQYFAIECGHEYRRFECGVDFNLRHRDEPGGVRHSRYRFYGCNERGACPHCGVAYGLKRGREQYGVMKALLKRRRDIAEGDVLAWGVVVTVPKELSHYWGEQIDAGTLPAAIAKVRGRANELFARHLFRVRKQDVMAICNTHFLSSKDPLAGWHIHFHFMIPNITPDARALANVGTFGAERLAAFKRDFYAYLLRTCAPAVWAWAGTLGLHPRHDADVLAARLNLETHFTTNTREGWRKLRHHCMYDARHVMADLRDRIERLEAEGKPAWEDPERFALFLRRSVFLQRCKTRNNYGYLSPGRRRELGVFEAPKPVSDWYEPLNSYRRLERFTDAGAVFRRSVGEYHDEEEADMGAIELRDMRGLKLFENVYARDGLFVELPLRKFRLEAGRRSRTKTGRAARAALEAELPGVLGAIDGCLERFEAVNLLFSPALARRVFDRLELDVGRLTAAELPGLALVCVYHDARRPFEFRSFGDTSRDELPYPDEIPALHDHLLRLGVLDKFQSG